MPVPRVDQAISGIVAGVQVQTTNAQPGSEMRIRIRGGNSLNGSNEPLIVVDGVIGADLNQINPNDVEIRRRAQGCVGDGDLRRARRERRGHRHHEARHAGLDALRLLGLHRARRTSRSTSTCSTADEFAKMFMRNPNHDKTVTLDTTVSQPTTDWQNTVFERRRFRATTCASADRPAARTSWRARRCSSRTASSRNSRFNRGVGPLQPRSAARRASSRRHARDVQSLDEQRSARQRRLRNGRRTGDDGRRCAGRRRSRSTRRTAATARRCSSSQTMDNPVAIVESAQQQERPPTTCSGTCTPTSSLLPELTFRSSLSYTSSDGEAAGLHVAAAARGARLRAGERQQRRHHDVPHGEHAHASPRASGSNAFTVLGGCHRAEHATATAPPRRASGSRAICSATIASTSRRRSRPDRARRATGCSRASRA